MSSSIVILVALCVVQTTLCQVLGNGIGCNNGFLNNGFNGLGSGIGLAGPVGPVGYGDVAVTGELPVGGNTAVAGQVPVIGYVTFEGLIPAGGLVSVANNGCGCNGIF